MNNSENRKNRISTDSLLPSYYDKRNNNLICMINNSKYLIVFNCLLSFFNIFLSMSYLVVILANLCFSFLGYFGLKKLRKIDFYLFFIFNSIINFFTYISQIILFLNYPYDLFTIFIILLFMIIQLGINVYFYFLFLQFKKYTNNELELIKTT